MADTWKRKRAAEEVPTPLAVAVSDYCRRAKHPASPTEVREALSVLGEEDDFRVRSVTDEDVVVEGLGPFAVVDLILGADADLCLRRQTVGYYDVVRELLRAHDEKALPALTVRPATPPVAVSLPEPITASVAQPASRNMSSPSLTIQEKIAPRKRTASEPSPPPEDLGMARGRSLPAPRGRFRQLEPVRRSLSELLEREGRAILEELMEGARHRVEIRDSLARDFHAPHGRPITLQDVDEALAMHNLEARILKEERIQLARLYKEHRGATGKVAWALGISTADLARLTKAHESELHLESMRETYRREALSPQNLAARLDLLGRTKYLADLGLSGKFEKALAGDLQALLEGVGQEDRSYEERLEAAATKADVPRELLGRALERLGLAPRTA
jgi:hypothetical protein